MPTQRRQEAKRAKQPDMYAPDVTARLDRGMLRRAALAGLRGAGLVEPNPMVGCVIGDEDGAALGIGHHRRFGGAHAEVEALANCRDRRANPRGATVWVTLEPCNHTGKTGPCTQVLIEAGITRVVIARPEPSKVAGGGAEALRRAGVSVEFTDVCPLATALAAAHAKRTAEGLPWVIAKWAQTLDGRIADSGGKSKWISGPASRRLVHRIRGRVDAILTGIGTVIADDPLLTARGAKRRRIARRVVVDPSLRIPEGCAMLKSLDQAPLTIGVSSDAASRHRDRIESLQRRGVEVVVLPVCGSGLDLIALLRLLSERQGAMNVLVESGPKLLGGLWEQRAIDEAIVFVSGHVLGDARAPGPLHLESPGPIDGAGRMALWHVGRKGDDAVLRYRRP